MLQQMLSQLGGSPGGPPQGGQESPDQGDNWLVDAINAVHEGMVQDNDPQSVSMLGQIINLLTTYQAKKASEQGQTTK